MTSFHWLSIFFGCCLAMLLSGCATAPKQSEEARVFEMRTYYAAPRKLNDLHARFRNHTMRLFEKHGIQNVGYWVPVNSAENKLVFLLSYPDRAARESSWKSFANDPEWKTVQQNSEAKGRLVERVEQVFLEPTDYSPVLKTGNASRNGVFELRTYTTPSGLLPNLDARFRDHTMRLFSKHGMNNWMYFHKTPEQADANVKLIYFLTHNSTAAAKASFDAFRQDPKWIAAKSESEKNGSLTVKVGGVKSEFLVATDYSPTK